MTTSICTPELPSASSARSSPRELAVTALTTSQLLIARSDVQNACELPTHLELKYGRRLLRWYVCDVTPSAWVVEATVEESEAHRFPLSTPRLRSSSKEVIAVNIVPTGIGCTLGGFAGDASPAVKLLSRAVDCVITNPNSVNGSDFFGGGDRIVYTEGYALDAFCRGKIGLSLPVANRLGVVIETAQSEILSDVFNVINAVRAVHGIDVVGCEVVPTVGNSFRQTPSGVSSGVVERPDILIEAARALVERGANTIAITTSIQNLPQATYVRHLQGVGPNPVGGIEAIISHYVSSRTGVPCAHAPLDNFRHPGVGHGVTDPRAAAEAVSRNGLACILLGLARSPQWREDFDGPVTNFLDHRQIVAVVAPATALGSVAVLSTIERGLPVIAVSGNSTILSVDAKKLDLKGVYAVRNYAEAAGVLLSLVHGIAPDTVMRPLSSSSPDIVRR